MTAGTFFSKPEYPDREPSRPKAVNPLTGKEQSWTRASNFAASLDNPHALIRWSNRNAVMGISRRTDLAAMALAGALRDDVAKVDETIRVAHTVMEAEANANLGTAAHAAITRAWQHPKEPVPEPYVPIVKAFAAALKEHELTIVAAAQKVMNLAYDSIGEFDLVLTEANGTHVIGDMKSGKLDHAKRKFAVQLAMYDGADYVVNPNNSVDPVPWKLAHSHGVLLHLDLENNTVSVYRIDLRIGRYGAGLAEQIRQWHTLDPLSPYVSPVVPRKAGLPAMQTDPPTQAAVIAEAAQQLDDHPGVTANEHPQPTAGVGSDPYISEIDQAAVTAQGPPQSRFDESRDITAKPDVPYDVEARFTELMDGLDKAQMQSLLKARWQWIDDAHNRRWLARAIIALEQGWTVPAQIKKYAAAKDDDDAPVLSLEGALQTAVDTGAVVPAGPSTATLLEAIRGANSAGAINALRTDIVERRGDQAWTDELVETARVRLVELGESSDEARTLALIQAAESKEALKDIWDRVTLGNTVPENWTPKMTELGVARLDEIKRATPPPPANPFA